ncbi:MAG: IS3 family transposase, partial [Lachnospiraceae bacterium]|nr:IS3 family transposase [Lachnospiraceae bacterium]
MFKKNFTYPKSGEKGSNTLTGNIFAAIRQEVRSGSGCEVKELCELAGVSRSGYYRWLNAADHRKEQEEKDLADFAKIKEAYAFRGYAKGYRGIRMRLFRMGVRMNHKKILRLMRKYGLSCPIRKANPYRRMVKALRTNSIAENQVRREFRSHGPRKIL